MQPVRRIPGQPGRFGLALLRPLTEHLRLIEFELDVLRKDDHHIYIERVLRDVGHDGNEIPDHCAQRSAVAFGDLADSISADEGVNGAGTLQVSLGAGSAAPADQIAFSATVASPYASTAFAVWDIHTNGGAAQNQGACVLWSSLLGAGRATTTLDPGGGAELQPCSPSWWSAGPVTPRQPRLGLARIPRSPR